MYELYETKYTYLYAYVRMYSPYDAMYRPCSDKNSNLLLITTSLFSMLCIIGCVYDIYQECIHPCMSVIRLVVITQVIRHPIAGHQGLPSVRAKLTNTIWDAHKPS